ncbi:MAG: gfo/Idh/MocA family oxidoreductase [Conexibacter sp.]|nr:gfo/Idh/MocA family oxidoreductase [Conexibacter sp.]
MVEPVLDGRPIVFGVVGLGYWGPNLLRVLGDDPGVTVKWICDLDPARLARFQRRHPTSDVTTDVQQVLSDPDVDAVAIATPIFTHFDLAAASLRAGKHTFVEKPMAPTAALADELMSLARVHERIIMCGHTFLYSPPVRTLKRMLDDRLLGDIFFVSSSRVNLGLHQRDVSVVWDLAPHDFSILRYWLDEMPETMRAIGRDSIVPGIADVAFITMTFGSGIVSNVELSWLAPSKLRRTVLVGSEKMAVYDDGTDEPIRLFDHGVIYRDPETFGQYHLSYRTGDIVSPKLDTYEPLTAELADFGRAIRDGDRMSWQAELARDVVLMTEAAAESLKQGGTEIEMKALRARGPRTSRQPRMSREPAR